MVVQQRRSNVPNAKDYNPAEYGLMVDVIGPPGSGKSHFARSALELGKGFGLLAPASELASYAGTDMDYEVIVEPDWKPSEGKFVASGWPQMLAALRQMEAGDYKVGIFDTMSSLADVVGHGILAGHRTANPQELSNPFVYYREIKNRVAEFVDRINTLRYKKKMHMIILWHEDVREVEGLGLKKKDAQGKEHWDTAKMPMLEGSLRNEIAKWFDLHMYAEPVVGSKPFRCKLHALPQPNALAKTRLRIVEKLQALAEVPNSFPQILKMVEEAYK